METIVNNNGKLRKSYNISGVDSANLLRFTEFAPGQHDGISDVIPEIALNYREIRRYLQRLSGVVRLDRESGRNPEQYPLLYFRFARKGGPATATVRKI